MKIKALAVSTSRFSAKKMIGFWVSFRPMVAILLMLFRSINASTYVEEPNPVSLSEAFFIQVERDWFKEAFPNEDEVQFSASLLDMPDLPNWMFCRHPNGSRNAFLYGSAQELGSMDIEIIALNKNNYDTAQRVMKLNVEPRGDVAQYEVEMKFLNLNVEDMFKAGRLSRLVEIYRNILWRESEILYVTKVVSSLDVGGRLPLNPNEKEGVVVRIGGTSEFSRTLQDLEREVQPLRNRFPCPRDYKRTSAEHLFRKRNFIMDWCSFHLISSKVDGAAGSTRELSNPTYTTALLHDDFKPQSINIPRRDLLFDFIVSIIVPSTVVGILSTALTCIMCCNKDGFEKKLGSDGNVQLGQYSVHCSTNENGDTYAERNSVQGSGYAGASSLPRSVGGSPNSTLHKSCTLRSSSRTSTLRGTMLPPPPYTPPPNGGSKRSATSTLTR